MASRRKPRQLGFRPRIEQLESRLALAVSVTDPFPDVPALPTDARQSVRLTGRFDDTEVTGTVVRFATNASAPFDQFFVELFDAAGSGRSRTTPVTAANFLRYVDAGLYANTFIHRSVPGFVVQAGGYVLANGLPHIETFAPIVNEFKTSNTRGTIAMAKVAANAPGGGPDSATSEWFVNLANNAAQLDGQNGGFTVFGRVLGTGMTLFDAIAEQVPRYDIRSLTGNGALDETPLLNIPNPVPTEFQLTVGNFLYFPAVERTGELILTVASSDASLVTPSFVAGSNGPALQLDHGTGRTGTAVITVRASSIFDPQDFVEDRFSVVIQPPTPPTDILLSSSTVAENLPAGTTVGSLTSIDPNIGQSHTYALVPGDGSADNASFTIDGGVLKTTAAFNFEAQDSYSIRVRSTDQGGLFAEKALTIAVTDVVDEPLRVESIAPTAATSYKAGEVVTFTVNLSELATVTGKPQLEFRLGTATRRAAYSGGSGTSRLAFQYRVGSKDNAEQITLGSALVVSTANAIVAGSERLAAPLPPGVANAVLGGLRFDTIAPTVSGRLQVPAAGGYARGQALTVVVTFTENVFVGGSGLPTILISGLKGGTRQAVYVSGSGTRQLTFRYVVQAGDAVASTKGLSLGGTITVNAASITDRDGKNPASLKLPTASLKGVTIAAGGV